MHAETQSAQRGESSPQRAKPPARSCTGHVRPNVFVVGDAKCGTTSLYYLFAASDQIGTVNRKEFHYFSAPELIKRIAGPGDEDIPGYIVHDEATYLREFSGLSHDLQAVVDISPSYLRNPLAAERIRAFAPDARIIILLREPAAKVFSQYVHLWTRFQENLPFEEALEQSVARRSAGYSDMFDYDIGGYYYSFVKKYIELFGEDRVIVILFEELMGHTDDVKRALSAFLGVRLANDPLVHANIGGRLRNPMLAAFLGSKRMARLRRAVIPPALRGKIAAAVRTRSDIEKPILAPELASRLRRRYAGDVEALENLLGRKTGWPAC